MTKSALIPYGLIFLLASIGLAIGLLQNQHVINTTGQIKTINVNAYQDQACTIPLNKINWGTIEVGSNKDHLCYLRNEGNAPIILYLNTDNWNPIEAKDFITLSWNYAENSIQPNDVASITLTLQISTEIQGITTFSFDIIITGEG